MITLTESAEEKRKRRLIASFKNYQWKYQYSIFPRLKGKDKGEDLAIASYALLEYDKELRRKLGEQFSDTAILFEFRRGRISKDFRPKYRVNFAQVYITFHSSKELDREDLTKLIQSIYEDDANFASRSVSGDNLEKSISTIQSQRSHAKIVREDGKEVNRLSIINRKNVILRL